MAQFHVGKTLDGWFIFEHSTGSISATEEI